MEQQNMFNLVNDPKKELSSFDGLFSRIIAITKWMEDNEIMTEIKISRQFPQQHLVNESVCECASEPSCDANEAEAEDDTDFQEACSRNIISNGKAMSIFFFGKKALQVTLRKNGALVFDIDNKIVAECPSWVSSIKTKKTTTAFLLTDINDFEAFFIFLQQLKFYFFHKLTPDPVGCCHRFLQCSDNRDCIIPHSLTSVACYYRRNLDNGKIFYGKNKNV